MGGRTSTAKGLTIRTHGAFYYKTAQVTAIRPFEMDVHAPSLEMFRETSFKYIGQEENGDPKYRENSYINIRGQLKKRLLPILLRKHHADFYKVRYVVIDEIIDHEKRNLDLPVTLRSREQLASLVKQEDIPIDVDDYVEVDELRSDIMEYQQDPKSFMIMKKRKDKKRSEEKKFLEMNDLTESLPPTNPVKIEGGDGRSSGSPIDNLGIDDL